MTTGGASETSRGAFGREDAAALIAALPALAILGWWTFAGGGYAPTVWLPGGLALLILLGAILASGAYGRLDRRAWLAVGAVGLYAGWSFLTTAWAATPATAWEGSDRALTYALVVGVMALVPWTRRAAVVAVCVWIAIVTAAAVTMLITLAGSHAVEQVTNARLAEPLGYTNANPALWTMAALPAIVLAGQRWMPVLARPVLLVAATTMLELAVLSQSRGWLFTLPVVLLAALALAPNRLRTAIFALPVAVALALFASALSDPFRIGGGRDPNSVVGPLGSALHHAAGTVLLGAALTGAIAAAMVIADRRLALPASVRRRARPIGVALLVLCLVGGAGTAVVATHGHPIRRASAAWKSFKNDNNQAKPGASRFSALGSGRYDFWRVALHEWSSHPIGGLGQDNFSEAYLRQRRTGEEPRWTHSLELRLLAHTGAVGALLFIAFLTFVGAGAAVLLRSRGPTRALGALALLPLVAWIVQGSVDWLWEIPAVSGPALGFAGMAIAVGAARRPSRPAAAGPPRSPRARVVPAALGALVGAAAALALFAPLLSAYEKNLAIADWRTNAPRAFSQLDRAASLDPLDANIPLTRGIIQQELGHLAAASEALHDAVRLDPGDWLARFQIGLLPRETDARAQLRRAAALNPKEDLIGEALRRLRTRHPLTLAEAESRYQQRGEALLGRAKLAR